MATLNNRRSKVEDAMKRVVHKARDFLEADEWDIRQHISMTPEERQEVSRLLRIRFYGENNPDVRDRAGER